MKIQFIGATHEVTGSCTLLEVCGKYYLVDCGMEQGKDVFQNIQLPVAAMNIEAVFLTHAHIDHSGMIPKLYKDGFRGAVYTTSITHDLCQIMLRDSAHIQESEAKWQARKAERAGLEPPEPTYTTEDAVGALGLFVGCRYDEKIAVNEQITVRFTDIGHLLGSACIELWLSEGNTQKKIVFSGDVGNTNQRIIRDPQRVAQTDYLVVESTYGNRLHAASRGDVVAQLAGYIQQALDMGGNVIIPSFAVGRTQEMLYAIREIKQRGLVTGHDGFPVYVDSPLAVEATNVFVKCDPYCFDEEAASLVKQGINPIWFPDLRLSVTAEESKYLNTDKEPKVIISASGMCEAGRIRHHLKHNLWRSDSVVLFVGYQAEGSLGRKLQNGEPIITLFGEKILVNAHIGTLNGTSGHADRDGLVNWVKGFEAKPEMVFVNHGDDDACVAFCDLLTEMGYKAEAPYSGTSYDLEDGSLVAFTAGVPIVKSQKTGNPRVEKIFGELVAEAEKLLALVKTRKGKTNKDNAKLTSQIRQLREKWQE